MDITHDGQLKVIVYAICNCVLYPTSQIKTIILIITSLRLTVSLSIPK
jgi:hypothetical protein